MKISAAFPSKYIKAADLNDKPMTLIIGRVDLEKVGMGDTDPKPVVYFTKAKKGMVLNKTNSKVISMAYGDDTDDWEGKTVTLFPAMVDFAGDTVEAIRVRIPKPAVAPKPAPQSHDELDPPHHGDMDDDIPF